MKLNYSQLSEQLAKNVLTCPRSFAGLVLLLTVGALLWSSNLYGRQSRAKGLDNAVEVVERKAVEGAMRITLKNTSSKNINALQVAVGPSVFFVEFKAEMNSKR